MLAHCQYLSQFGDDECQLELELATNIREAFTITKRALDESACNRFHIAMLNGWTRNWDTDTIIIRDGWLGVSISCLLAVG